MSPEHVTVDEQEDGGTLNRPWSEVIDDFLAVLPFDKDAIIDRLLSQIRYGQTAEGLVTQTVDSTLRGVVEWLSEQGHTAIARDLKRAGDI
jgi:hypothetical protein